eukprot:g10672.t1
MLTSRSTEVLGWILVIAILSPLLGGLIVITHAVLRHFRPGNVFGVFLCHHKGGAGALCRWMKLMAAQHSSSEIFLDSDQLEDLDLIFDTIRAKTRSVVVVLTSELLQRMWCAGEIVTAFKNHVCTLPLVCDGYEPLTDATFMEVPSVWTEQQKQILAFYGISMEETGTVDGAREQLVVEILQRVKVPLKLFRPKISHGKVKARILLTGSVSDAEALSTLEVFQHLLQRHLRKECAVVRSGKELLAYKPWAYYLVVLLSRGILRDPGFAQTLLSVYIEDSKQPRPLELVTVNADTQFQFPSPEFLVEVEEHGLGGPLSALGPELSKAYRGLLNILALPLSPMASQGLLERQTAEVCRRFRRYKNSVFAAAMDDEDDQHLEGDGMFNREEVRSSLQAVGKPITWTEAGATVEGILVPDAAQPSEHAVLGAVVSSDVDVENDVATEPCVVCGGPTVLCCSGCEDVFYCSISCQQKDWATHRLACHRHSDQVAQKALSSAVVLPETKDRGCFRLQRPVIQYRLTATHPQEIPAFKQEIVLAGREHAIKGAEEKREQLRAAAVAASRDRRYMDVLDSAMQAYQMGSAESRRRTAGEPDVDLNQLVELLLLARATHVAGEHASGLKYLDHLAKMVDSLTGADGNLPIFHPCSAATLLLCTAELCLLFGQQERATDYSRAYLAMARLAHGEGSPAAGDAYGFHAALLTRRGLGGNVT